MTKPKYTIGVDPELFLKLDGKPIGSERVVPAGAGLVVRDGFQVEFNPPASMSISVLGSWISKCFSELDRMVKLHPGVEISFDEVVDVDMEELNSLSERSRILGSGPSFNVYGTKPLKCDRDTYLVRSAAGHMHFGLRGPLFDERVRLASWLDVFVGNTLVLVDREPRAAERRENYGRAGEYRIPNYGLEYRTPSNFWLRSYTMMDFAFRLADMAIGVVQDGIDGGDLESRLIEVVDINRVIEAIDTNNIELAKENFKDISKVHTGFQLAFGSRFIKWFKYVADKNNWDGYSLSLNPVEYWIRSKQVPFESHLMSTFL